MPALRFWPCSGSVRRSAYYRPSGSFAGAALLIAVLLTVGGLASSVFHLGRPERAWRAFSQWRSSWLSREGVFAVLTMMTAAGFGIGWALFGATDGLTGLCGILAAGLAAVTIYCTGMIYASLRPIHQWYNHWVVPNYLVLALMSGCLVLDFLIRFWPAHYWGIALQTSVVVLAAWWMKERYWRSIDTTSARSTVVSATSLGSRGGVRMLEAPHTEENYLLKEMGFRDRPQAPEAAAPHRSALRLRGSCSGERQWLSAWGSGRQNRGRARCCECGARPHSRTLALFCRSKAHRGFVLWRRCGLIPNNEKANRILIDAGIWEGL